MNGCAVILAAGLSSRMGAFKPLLKLGDKTMIERVYHTLADGGCRQVIIVIGYQGESIRDVLAGEPITWVENPNYASTDMLTSLRLGLQQVADPPARILITPSDIPLFTVQTVQTLLALPETVPAAVPFYGGKTGHPIMLSPTMWEVISTYQGNGGLAGALQAGHVEPVPIPVPDEGILYDADRPEDFLHLQQIMLTISGHSGRRITAPTA